MKGGAKAVKKTGRFLVVDVSNSFTKFSLSTASRLGPIGSHPTPQIDAGWLAALARRHPGIPLFLSSVVPQRTRLFERAFGDRLHRLHGTAPLGIPISYRNPRQVGPDRLANAIAARHLYGAPAIVIDFGTAVTFDVLDKRGAYSGGVIAPGLNLMTDYLHERTALLPLVTIREPRRAIAQSTEEAIRVGAVTGYRGMIREILGAIKKELIGDIGGKPPKIRVIATGGQAAIVSRRMPEIEAVLPALTLDGLRIWGAGILAAPDGDPRQ